MIRRKANRRHMIGDHHGRTAGRATLLVTDVDGILGTHNIMTAGFYRGAQSETKQEAGHSGQHWADDELAIITRPDLSTKQAALLLGRTYASVARRRHFLRHHQHMTRRAELHGVS
jgi:hypothetical protein